MRTRGVERVSLQGLDESTDGADAGTDVALALKGLNAIIYCDIYIY